MSRNLIQEARELYNTAHNWLLKLKDYMSATAHIEVSAAVEQIPALCDENSSLRARLAEAEGERDAAAALIDRLEVHLNVIGGATLYVKPNTGVWHTTMLALDAIKDWRGKEPDNANN